MQGPVCVVPAQQGSGRLGGFSGEAGGTTQSSLSKMSSMEGYMILCANHSQNMCEILVAGTTGGGPSGQKFSFADAKPKFKSALVTSFYKKIITTLSN